MAKLTKAKLKKKLQEQTKEQLIDAMMTLFENKEIAEQINLIYNPDYEKEYLEQAKKKIYKSFFPTRTSINTKISGPKKIVTDFSKLSNNYYNIADLQLYYVETVLEILDLDCITDSLLNSFVDMLWESIFSLNHLEKQQSIRFFSRLHNIEHTCYTLGYGLDEAVIEPLANLDDYFNWDDENE